ncbi:MAG: hypothetical protein JST89_09635 [Cyanobacteria bacterium SZAS-4]|nr:hypothetical protein [Cyanobacteria bacterium SZAS-4]
MAFQSDKKCPYCAETIRALAEICRFCNRTVMNAKLCIACCEPLRPTALICRFCKQEQPATSVPAKEEPAVTGIAPGLTFGFQIPAHNPVYTPIEPKKLPEQCQAEKEFQNWQKQRRDAITYGDKENR